MGLIFWRHNCVVMGVKGSDPPPPPLPWIDDGELHWIKTGVLCLNSPSDITRRILIINFKLRFILQDALQTTSTRTKEWRHKHENNKKVKWFRLDEVEH